MQRGRGRSSEGSIAAAPRRPAAPVHGRVRRRALAHRGRLRCREPWRRPMSPILELRRRELRATGAPARQSAVDDVSLAVERGTEHRPGGRVRLRQDARSSGCCSACCGRPAGEVLFDGVPLDLARPVADARVPSQRADRSSRTRTRRSIRGSASAASWASRCDRCGSPRGADADALGRRGARSRSACRRTPLSPIPARVLRRAAPAHRDRAGHRQPTARAPGRRAGQRPRCHHPQPGHRAARGARRDAGT